MSAPSASIFSLRPHQESGESISSPRLKVKDQGVLEVPGHPIDEVMDLRRFIKLSESHLLLHFGGEHFRKQLQEIGLGFKILIGERLPTKFWESRQAGD